jgi:hypothetical protein
MVLDDSLSSMSDGLISGVLVLGAQQVCPIFSSIITENNK